MAKYTHGDGFPTMTHGGAPNIRACRLPKDTWQLSTLTGNEMTATITYAVPADEVCFYYASFGTPHPECGDRYYLTDVSAKQTTVDCAELTETYKITQDNGGGEPPDPNDAPDPVYALRTSEFAEPIQLSDRFWLEFPGPSIFQDGEWVCDPNNLGELADWAKGFVGDVSEGNIPEGMSFLTDGKDRNAFPACHPKFGIDSYLESGAEWTCTQYDVGSPSESDISGGTKELHTIDNSPQGLVGATAGKWLYVSFSSEFDGLWWNSTAAWRYNKRGWDTDIYGGI